MSKPVTSELLDAKDDIKLIPKLATISPIKNYHILKIARRFFLDNRNLQSVIEFVNELKGLFPDGIFLLFFSF